MIEKEQGHITSGHEFKYFAFISYNSRDTQWGKRLQRKLEHYRMPATMCNQRGWKRTPIRPVFFAPTDIQPGGLSDELKQRLRASRNLIVICSPNSAKSEWVGKEIEFFHSLGRTENIHFFIVDGTPHSGDPDTECFHPVTERLGLQEILGANVNEKNYKFAWINRERAYVQLVSKLLDVEFDSIWQRHKRQLLRQLIFSILGLLAVVMAIFGAWYHFRPVDATLRLREASYHNNELPPLRDAVVMLELDNESKTDTIVSLDDAAIFTNIPQHFLNHSVHVTVNCPDFMPIDTMMELSRDMNVNIYRDVQVYGNVSFGLWDRETESFIPNSPIQVGGVKTRTDSKGKVSVFIPLEQQRTTYQVNALFPLYNSTITMPCGENDVVEKL